MLKWPKHQPNDFPLKGCDQRRSHQSIEPISPHVLYRESSWGGVFPNCHTLIFDPPEMTYLQDFHQDKTSTQSSHSSIWYLIGDAQRQESSGKGSFNTRISL